jgi:DNA-binding transcriptional MerR regulator
MQTQLTIGPFARRVGASIGGVRRWCEIGLLNPPRVGRVRVFGENEIRAVEAWRREKTERAKGGGL